MKTNRIIKNMAALALLSAFSLQPSALLGQGSLTPPGPPAPTMKSADQIEPRTPISSAPFIISASGSYYLTTNLTVSSGNAITIATNNVTLDLMGFTIVSIASSASGNGILLTNSLSDTTIVNGHIRSGVTNNGSGVYTGTGFAYGIFSASPLVNVVISKVSVAGVLDDGIYLGHGNGTLVEACTVKTAGDNGILASIIKGSAAIGCGGYGIYGDQVADCQAISSAGEGIYASTTALNCYGNSSVWGLRAGTLALNCFGQSGSGDGLWANIALNCYGYSYSGRGLAANMANSCWGDSVIGTGLTATYGNFCFGSSVSVTTKYNMP